MEKILVTGGAGFIGSHIVKRLLDEGAEVIVVDNLSTGIIENVNDKAIFYQIDVTDEHLIEVFEKERPDYVYHLAAQSNVSASIENPVFDADVNILGTVNLLNISQQYSVSKFIYASSAAIYGSPIYLGIDENHPINPNSFYGISKYVSEQYIKNFSKLYGLNYLILRYANVFGPRQICLNDGGVIANFIDKLLLGERPIIHDDGQQTRDFIYIKDVVDANILGLYKGKHMTLNIGTGQGTSINQLFELVTKVFKYRTEPIYTEGRIGDIKDSYFNVELAKSVLGWQAQYSLKKGLEETIAYKEKLILRKSSY